MGLTVEEIARIHFRQAEGSRFFRTFSTGSLVPQTTTPRKVISRRAKKLRRTKNAVEHPFWQLQALSSRPLDFMRRHRKISSGQATLRPTGGI